MSKIRQEWSRDMITVTVRYRSPGSRSQPHRVMVNQSSTIAKFISHVTASKGLTPDTFSLTFRGLPLDKHIDKTLSSYNVEGGSTIDLWSYVLPKRTKNFTVQIHVYQISDPLKLAVLSSTTVKQLTHMIQDEVGMPVAEQLLLHQGKPVRRQQQLVEQYHIKGPFALQWQEPKAVYTDCTNDNQEEEQEPDQEPQQPPPPPPPPTKQISAGEVLMRISDIQVSYKGLREVSKEIMKWKPLGDYLGIKPPQVIEIEKDHPGEYLEQKYQLLLLWKRKNGKHATWRALASAVYECNKDLELVEAIERLSKAEESGNPLPAHTISDVDIGVEESQPTAPRHFSPQHSTASLGEVERSIPVNTEETESMPTPSHTTAERGAPHHQPKGGHSPSIFSKKRLTLQELADQLKPYKHKVRSTAIKLGLSHREICATDNDPNERLRQFCDAWLAKDPDASLEKFNNLQ